jgi:hypothetical protein
MKTLFRPKNVFAQIYVQKLNRKNCEQKIVRTSFFDFIAIQGIFFNLNLTVNKSCP